jgi:hypothetical protein
VGRWGAVAYVYVRGSHTWPFWLVRCRPFLVVSLSPDQKKEGSGRGAIMSWFLVND